MSQTTIWLGCYLINMHHRASLYALPKTFLRQWIAVLYHVDILIKFALIACFWSSKWPTQRWLFQSINNLALACACHFQPCIVKHWQLMPVDIKLWSKSLSHTWSMSYFNHFDQNLWTWRAEQQLVLSVCETVLLANISSAANSEFRWFFYSFTVRHYSPVVCGYYRFKWKTTWQPSLNIITTST